MNTTDPGLIGKFGVGFYSAFLVADKVQVISKSNEDNQYIWESSSQESFKLSADPRGNTLGRGTEIILHLKDDAAEFLDQNKLEEIIKKHSEFVNFPIYLWSESTVEEKVESEPETESDVEDVTEKKTETITKTVADWKLINENKPIWTRPSSDVTKEEYNAFFKAHFKEINEPLAYTHFKLEGDNRFTALLFVPASPPARFLQPDAPSTHSCQLFVRRVFITDELSQFIPKWLGFIKGTLD